MNPPDLAPILTVLREGRPGDARAACQELMAAGHDTAQVHTLQARACLALNGTGFRGGLLA